jgi:hypothetical protein
VNGPRWLVGAALFIAVSLLLLLVVVIGGEVAMQSASACGGGSGQLGSSRVIDAEAKLGMSLAYSREYIRTWGARVAVASGHVPVLSINTVGTTWAAVASGSQDSVIREQARQVAAIPGTVYLSLDQEPENAPGSPAQLAAAWRHYVAIYRAAGVINVRWTLILLASSFNGGGQTADAYYPGDDVVDVVAADGYNWQGVRPVAGRSFAQVFTAFYAWGAAHRKPMMIAGFGMAAVPGRAQWITNAAATVRSWPSLQAVLWSDAGDFTIGPDAVPRLQAFNSPAVAGGPADAALPGAGGLSWDQVKGYAAAGGFTGADLDIATAITEPESGRDPLARNPSGASGLWQILPSAHPDLFSRYDWRDPAQNARMAYAVYTNARRSFTPWVTYTSGAYLQDLPEAATAEPVGGGAAGTTAGCTPATAGGGGDASPGMSTVGIPCAAGVDGGVVQAPGGVAIRLCTVGRISVNTTLSGPLARLLDAAAVAGLRLGGGGFRSQAEQIVLRRAHCLDVWTSPPSACHPPTAIPGTSQHEWGLAIDFTSSGHSIGYHSDPAWQWLTAHAASYGLRGLISESWHWSTTGR